VDLQVSIFANGIYIISCLSCDESIPHAVLYSVSVGHYAITIVSNKFYQVYHVSKIFYSRFQIACWIRRVQIVHDRMLAPSANSMWLVTDAVTASRRLFDK